jgi:hypothetical protein
MGPPLRSQRGEGGAADQSSPRGFTGWKFGLLIGEGGNYKVKLVAGGQPPFFLSLVWSGKKMVRGAHPTGLVVIPPLGPTAQAGKPEPPEIPPNPPLAKGGMRGWG